MSTTREFFQTPEHEEHARKHMRGFKRFRVFAVSARCRVGGCICEPLHVVAFEEVNGSLQLSSVCDMHVRVLREAAAVADVPEEAHYDAVEHARLVMAGLMEDAAHDEESGTTDGGEG